MNAVREHPFTGVDPPIEYPVSWLCPEPGDRERLLDMDRRLRRSRAIAMSFLGVALVVSGPWVGWWPVAILAGLAIAWFALDTQVSRVRRPEWILATGWVLSALAIAGGVMLTGAAHSPAKSWLLVPAITLPARFSTRGLYAGIIFTFVLLAAVTIGADPRAVADEPQLFVFPAALIGATLALSMALRDAELQHRSESVIDPLTGMLNRKALELRTIELEQQSRVTGQPVGLIVCDIDNFKRVNDVHGHAVGDAVLQDVAYRIRKELRAYDLAYRLGGEEFVVLVPGAGREMTRELAERLLSAIEVAPSADVDVTASFGVAASTRTGFEFEPLFRRADEALYRAKADGRNCVRDAREPDPTLA